jgi:hypothetical protein
MRLAVATVVSGLCCLLIGSSFMALAQEKNKKRDREEPKVKPLPNDPELLALHREFVKNAEKLAFKYEKEKDWSKAKDCYEEILKLVPAYPPARAKVADLLQLEATAKHVSVTVSAQDKDWKDTGVIVQEGRPITIRANGTWTFRMTAVVGAQGIRIPDELREFDPGSLVGMIVPVVPTEDSKEIKPFIVGPEKQMIPAQTGKLLLRMYDFDMRDNEGELTVDIRGTFFGDETKPAKSKEK